MKEKALSYLFVALIVAVAGAVQSGCRSRSNETSSATAPGPAAPVATATPELTPTPESLSTPEATPERETSGVAGEAATAAEKPEPPRTFTLSSGRVLSVYTTSDISTKTHKVGDTFTGSLSKPIMDGDRVIAKKGAPVEGVVTSADPGGRVKGVASIAVALKQLTLADGRTVEVSTSPYSKQAPTSRKSDAKKIGIGAGAGAVIGAIAGGGKGAAIGAGVGGGAGTAATMATHGDPAVIPGETLLTFRLAAPVTITER